MNNNLDDFKELQNIIEHIFPVSEVPLNSMLSSVNRVREDNAVYFLIVGDNQLLKPFLEDTEDEAKIKTVLKVDKAFNKVYYDLILELYFYFRRGKATFRLDFRANLPVIQKQYVAAFKQVDSFRFIIMDQNKKIHKVLELDWYYYKNKKVIEKIEKYNHALFENQNE